MTGSEPHGPMARGTRWVGDHRDGPRPVEWRRAGARQCPGERDVSATREEVCRRVRRTFYQTAVGCTVFKTISSIVQRCVRNGGLVSFIGSSSTSECAVAH